MVKTRWNSLLDAAKRYLHLHSALMDYAHSDASFESKVVRDNVLADTEYGTLEAVCAVLEKVKVWTLVMQD